MNWDQLVNCAWHKPVAIVQVKTGNPVPLDVIEKAPDSKEKRLIAESHGICMVCAKANFPNLDHKLLFEGIMDQHP